MSAKRTVKVIHEEDGWFKKQLSIGNLLSVGSIFVAAAGFYFTTNANFDAQSKEIASIRKIIADSEKKDERKEQTMALDRDTLRKEVNDLSKTTAVLSAQLVTTNSELMKLGQKIDTLIAPATIRR